MTTEDGGEKVGPPGAPPATRAFQRLAARARLALAWERLWPRLVGILVLIGLFIVVSWLGVWLDLPRYGRIGGLAAFGLALLVLLAHAARTVRPSSQEAMARLDRDSGLPHRPASALADRLAGGADDPTTQALWQLHVQRLRATAARLRVAPPSPRVAERDRFAVRAAAVVALVAAGFVAGPEKFARLAAALDWRTEGAIGRSFRLDAWIDPPPYTGRPPILLPVRVGDASDQPDATQARKIRAPVGSSVVVRTSGEADITADAEGGLAAPPPPKIAGKATADPLPVAAPPKPDAETGGHELRWVLKGDARLVLRRSGRAVAAFEIGSIPDQPPVIALTEAPTSNVRGSLTLSYKIGDDYGVNAAEATFAQPMLHGKPVSGRWLVGPPRIGLTLPAAPGGLGQAQTIADLAENPWSGAQVTMTLTAHDDGGNEGRSAPVPVTLPQRPFAKPLAKALVEQRRNLILAPDEHGRVTAALDGLMIAPERFTPDPSIYLGLYTAGTRLRDAKNDDDLRSVADLLWDMAVRIEDGDLSDAERALRAAEQRLRDALQHGASDEEIRKRTEELRAALDKFLSEMAQRQPKNGNQRADGSHPERWVTPQDLKSMLDRMDEMARSGDLADAQQLLDQLQNTLENLKNAQRDSGADQASREMEQSLDQLDKMTRDQQQLRDDTFRDGQRARRQRDARRRQNGGEQPGQEAQGQQDQGDQADGDQGDDQSADGGQQDEAARGLEGRQQGLRQQLDELRRRMKQLGMSSEQGLDDAESAMGEAEGALGKGQRGKAVDAQGRALESLRRGAQGLAQQMQQQGNGTGDADGSYDGPGNPRGNGQDRRDPLDRPSRFSRDMLRGGLLNVGPGAAQRAQQVLEELRRRLADPARPQEELDYLERLLRPY